MSDKASLKKVAASHLGIVAAAATAAMLVSLAGPAGIVGDARSTARLTGNVKSVTEVLFVANNTARNSIAKCPSGTRVLGGGFASNGIHAEINAAGPSRSENGYIVYAFTPPRNINTGVGREIARITIVAYCAPIGQPVVFG